MRITNAMIVNNFMNNMNRNLARMDKLQGQIGTMKKNARVSDDPIGVATSMMARARLMKIDQYAANVANAKTWTTQSETALSEMNEMLKRIEELHITSANGTNSEESRTAIAQEVEQMRDQILTSLNYTYGDRFIFGGYNTDHAPFVYNGGELYYDGVPLINQTPGDIANANVLQAQQIEYELIEGIKLDVSMSGVRVIGMGDKNIIGIIDKYIAELKSPSTPPVDYITELQKSQTHILSLMSEVGGKQNRLDLMEDRYSIDDLNYSALLSVMEDIDLESTTTEFKMAECVYQAALSMGARIIQPSLLDFLK